MTEFGTSDRPRHGHPLGSNCMKSISKQIHRKIERTGSKKHFSPVRFRGDFFKENGALQQRSSLTFTGNESSQLQRYRGPKRLAKKLLNLKMQ